jgi:integrase
MKSEREKPVNTSRRLTKYQGVYERESDIRTFKGRPDVCFDISYKVKGKKIWEKAGWISEGYSAKLAADVRAERIRSIRHGEELPREKKKLPYFKDLMTKYLSWSEENRADKGAHDKTRYNLHLAPYLAEKRLDEINSFDLEKIKSDLLKKGLSPATVKYTLIIVRQSFNKALAWGMYKGLNPIKGVKLPVLQNTRERFLSYEEADQLLSELAKRSPDVHDMALLSLYTGARAGEVFSLKCHDIDFTHGLISILDTKNKQARRVFITDAVKDMLSRRIKDLSPDAYIFLRKDGTPYFEMADIFKTVADELFNKNVQDRRQRVTFHNLRHTFASWLALQGESLMTIRELLGHKSFTMTQRYAHLIPDEKKRAVVALAQAFDQKKNGTVENIVSI